LHTQTITDQAKAKRILQGNCRKTPLFNKTPNKDSPAQKIATMLELPAIVCARETSTPEHFPTRNWQTKQTI
jgi:hypothetical protein